MHAEEPRPGFSGPDTPLQALALEYATLVRERAVSLTFTALEHLLEQQPWARERLARHAGRTVMIGVTSLADSASSPPQWRAVIDADGYLRPADPAQIADATIRLDPSVDALFALLREGTVGLQRHLRVEGDVTLAATLAELAQHLRWEAEEDLSRLVGDIAAHRARAAAGRAAEGLRELAENARMAFARFASGGTQVVARPQLADLAEEASRLDQRLRALEARLQGLSG